LHHMVEDKIHMRSIGPYSPNPKSVAGPADEAEGQADASEGTV
jgi:hypothetical protein